LQDIAKTSSESDDTLRNLVMMGYKLDEASIAIERLGVFCFHLYVSLACYFANSLSSIDFEHMDLCPLSS